MKRIHLGLALTVLAILPRTADAGLIPFGWQINGIVYPLPGSPSPGQIDIPTSCGGPMTSNQANSQVTIGTISLSNWSTAMPNANGSNLFTEFGVVVTLTDQASGQSGKVTAYGDAFSSWKQQPNGSWLPSIAGIGVTYPATVTLGNNVYRVGIDPAFSSPDSTAPVIANVEVSVTSLATPEPATLFLAAGGLPLVGFFYRSRRANVAS